MPKKDKANFTKEEMKYKIFNIEDHQHKIFMPNEIFNELKGYVNDDGEYIEGFYDVESSKIPAFKSSTHIAYAYTYVYLAHYMYRYCKHYTRDGTNIDEDMIRQLLGVSATSKSYNYITKKDGMLDRLGYIRKQSDIPIEAVTEKVEYTKKTVQELRFFRMENEIQLPSSYGKTNTKNRKINYPVKAFHRTKESEEEFYEVLDNEDENEDVYEYDGTFYDVDNTHLVDINVFIYCMSDLGLGVEGFYLYCFILRNSSRYGENNFTCSRKRMAQQTELSMAIIKRQLINLEKRNMIVSDHKPYCYERPSDKTTKANAYYTLSYDSFKHGIFNFNLIPKQRTVSAEQYTSEVGFVEDDTNNEGSGMNDKSGDKKYSGSSKSKIDVKNNPNLKKVSDLSDEEKENLFMGSSPFDK